MEKMSVVNIDLIPHALIFFSKMKKKNAKFWFNVMIFRNINIFVHLNLISIIRLIFLRIINLESDNRLHKMNTRIWNRIYPKNNRFLIDLYIKFFIVNNDKMITLLKIELVFSLVGSILV